MCSDLSYISFGQQVCCHPLNRYRYEGWEFLRPCPAQIVIQRLECFDAHDYSDTDTTNRGQYTNDSAPPLFGTHDLEVQTGPVFYFGHLLALLLVPIATSRPAFRWAPQFL